MKTTTQTTQVKVHEQESFSQSSAQVGIGIIAVASLMIGLWGIACLVGGLSQYGVTGMLKGWISAIIGM